MGQRLWILGGNDGEMEAIKMLLGMAGESYLQPRMEWGDHRYNMKDCLVAESQLSTTTFMFVECQPTGSLKSRDVHIIDHHCDRSSEPASVLQVLKILEESGLRIADFIRRWIELIAANDCGAYNGMEGLDATPDEIKRVRAYTRKAQGITAEHEAVAKLALESAREDGNVLVVQLPGRSVKNVCLLDELYETGRKSQVYLIVNPGNFHFSGDGETCARLKQKFGGWAGGAELGKKGEKAFWGYNGAASKVEEVLAEIKR